MKGGMGLKKMNIAVRWEEKEWREKKENKKWRQSQSREKKMEGWGGQPGHVKGSLFEEG